eukprot:CAMPEP_0170178112 /NCGR_PEP_ID=MMETSP0040_2-20121228/11672_1 /TAXON_ID=641309 /ORGANISM="Lotharella oceanica, Strain CCMP622" /LENGTH=183 /DNA_ID=CAMNT_0010421077 /DNA_START=98 /DNA_END=649 /DNA_ORIENTATION=+
MTPSSAAIFRPVLVTPFALPSDDKAGASDAGASVEKFDRKPRDVGKVKMEVPKSSRAAKLERKPREIEKVKREVSSRTVNLIKYERKPRKAVEQDNGEDDIDEDDLEWEEALQEMARDLREKIFSLSYSIGKSVGPAVVLMGLGSLGFQFQHSYPYRVAINAQPRETHLIRWLLNFVADQYDV